jgi:excisionase family DNA binding protein
VSRFSWVEGELVVMNQRQAMADLRDSSRPPDFLRVEEAAAVLRIGRTSAYELARQFLVTDGATGLPVVRVGRQLRVPRAQLERLAGGPITWPPTADAAGPEIAPLAPVPARPVRRESGQPSLPFAG